ncbi:hypothetical protein [Peptoniphilus stercorisuis]|uniref:DUF1700 domain-containing protein n=1 Tax=Peptoniphilus stercorisuis TaxID=1436965 RepID=A0ABS4KCW4_9FIRM|nr:hypothetical protein [Peptoniphilus stercorisuis]MBP2025623.1 hypothetical protein [Peptoniphilus stercorisuis]
MNLENSELFKRYIHELTRYLNYEDSNMAVKDLKELIEEELGSDFEEDKLEKYLKKLGHPYNFASHYDNKTSVLVSGKNYDIYTRLLKILSIVMLSSLLISYYKGSFIKVGISSFLRVVLGLMLNIFISLTISFFIAEKVKTTKMISSLLKDFNIDDLYRNLKYKKVNPSIEILIIIYSLVIFIAMISLKLHNEDYIYKMFQAIFFLSILRDVNKLSESYYRKFVVFLMIITDLTTLIIGFKLLKNPFIVKNILRRAIIILMLSTIWDVLSALIKIIKAKKGINRPFLE